MPTKKIRMKIGIVNATKAATAAMEKRALMAMGPAKIRLTMRQPIVVLNQTALTGVCVWRFTRLMMCEAGKQSSRA